MRIVYLILAHKNPFQLHKLTNALRNVQVSIVVHLDKNVDIDEYRAAYLKEFADLHFIHDRFCSSWGSFDMVQATLSGLKYITDNLPESTRVILMSGQDYPIKSNSDIFSFFEKNQRAIYLEYFKIPYKDWANGGIGRFPNFNRINSLIKLYGGSQWWSFPMDVVIYILEFLEKNPSFLKYFRTVSIPDESFFQTLLLNCEEAFIDDNLISNNLRFIKWLPPYLHPSVLREKDMNDLAESDFLYARKFDLEIEPKIYELLDSVIKKRKININEVKTQVFLYLTNCGSSSSILEYQSFSRSVSEFGTCRLLFHQPEGLPSRDINNLEPHIFNNSILTSLGYTAIDKELIPGSNHFPLFDFYSSNPNFDYYWLIEDDVRFNGDWKLFFNTITEDIDADFLSCHIHSYNKQTGWHWWYTLKHPEKRLPDSQKLRSFNPIYRISNSALRFLHKQMLNGWSGHHEVLIPTLLALNGFKINDFGGSGDYVLPNFENLFYKSSGPDHFGGLGTSTIRYRPVIDLEEMTEPILYHPVKPSTYNDANTK